MDNGSVTAYRDASRFLVEAVRAVPDSGWDAPGLGDWNVRELVGHANRGHTTVADYLVRPQQPEPPGSTYFSDEAIAARGREAVRALGADPASAVAAASTAVVELIEQSPPVANSRTHHPRARYRARDRRRPVRAAHGAARKPRIRRPAGRAQVRAGRTARAVRPRPAPGWLLRLLVQLVGQAEPLERAAQALLIERLLGETYVGLGIDGVGRSHDERGDIAD